MSVPVWMGHRGSILFWIGTSWLLQATALLVDGWRPIPVPSVTQSLPDWLLALPWAVTGSIALLGVRRRHPGGDRIGFAAAIIMPSVMVALWTTAVMWDLFHGPTASSLVGAVSAAWTWCAVAFMLITVARWPEAPDGFVPPRDIVVLDGTPPGGDDDE